MSDEAALKASISFVRSSRWYFRSYTGLAVAILIALMPFPETSWFYNAISIYLLCGLAGAIKLAVKMEDLVSDRRCPWAASCFGWFHGFLCLALWTAAIEITDFLIGHEEPLARIGELTAPTRPSPHFPTTSRSSSSTANACSAPDGSGSPSGPTGVAATGS